MELSLLFICQLSESQIMKVQIENTMQKESMKSGNPIKSVVQISYDIVKAHGGEIIIESELGSGSECIIKLTK